MSDPSAVNTVLDSCCLCGFVFVDKKRKRSITGENKLHKESSKHKRRKDGDIYVVVSTVQEVDVLNEITGRTHCGIETIPEDPISALNFKDLNVWLSKHKKSWVNPNYN